MTSVTQEQTRIRLDQFLTEQGHFASRSRARDAIARATVTVDGSLVTKAGQMISPHSVISISDPAQAYVSRAALKLVQGLDHFQINPSGKTALDIGASTGGFTQVLLERGASHVTAIDVGHGQMHPDIADHPHVSVREGLNARHLTLDHLPHGAPDLIVSDVSFISLKLALPPALAMALPGARCILLVKPQFEAGRDAIGKGGLLKDPEDGPRLATELWQWLNSIEGWKAEGSVRCDMVGSDGNTEFLLSGIKSKVRS